MTTEKKAILDLLLDAPIKVKDILSSETALMRSKYGSKGCIAIPANIFKSGKNRGKIYLVIENV